jgi:hypothetical protein
MILFVNSAKPQCGVHQYGKMVFHALKKSRLFSLQLAKCNNREELIAAIDHVKPRAVLYNFSPWTLPFIDEKFLRQFPKIAHLCLAHELNQAPHLPFRARILADPTLIEKPPHLFKTGRLLLTYENRHPLPEIPTIGSFGFGYGAKGFDLLIKQVQKEFDRAIIRLNIPSNDIIDITGERARNIATFCQQLIYKPGITLQVSHDFLSEGDLLDFLAQNSLNAFFYRSLRCTGFSSSTDLALAVKRPIAVNGCSMFRHFFSLKPSVVVNAVEWKRGIFQRRRNATTLRQILEEGTAPLEPLYKSWTEDALIADYERIFRVLCLV